MKRTYNLSYRLISYVLLISLFLQSCDNFINPPIPIKQQQADYTQIATEPLEDKQFISKDNSESEFSEFFQQSCCANVGGNEDGYTEEGWPPIYTKPKGYAYTGVTQTSSVDNSESELSDGEKRAESVKKNNLVKNGALAEQLLENTINGIRVKRENGRQHITEIEFQKVHAQKIAPHLIDFVPWKDIPSFVLITGKNGSGKSQLLKYINSVLINNNFTRLGINVLLRGPEDNNNNIHYDSNREANYYINGPVQRKNLVQAIKRYCNTGSRDRNMELHPIYNVIIKRINKGKLPKPTDNDEEWDTKVGQFIDRYKDYCSESHNVNEPISILSQVFSVYAEKVKKLLDQYRNFEYLNVLFSFYCERENKDSESVDSYKLFLKNIQNEEFINKHINLYIKERLNLSPPWEEINKILDKYNFTYKIRFINEVTHVGMRRDKNFILERSTEQSPIAIEVNLDELSSGERLMLDLMSWLFYFRGVSADGKNPAQVKHLDIMLLDEPDRHLDPELCKKLYEVIYNEFVLEHNIQVIMTTHRLDTVISAPEESIYIMGEQCLEHDTGAAVSRMTSNVIKRACNSRIAASVLSDGRLAVIEDVNYVLVENKDDVKFYSIVYQKLLASGRLDFKRTKLIFQPVGINLTVFVEKANGLQSCVNEIMEKLKLAGNAEFQGLLDKFQGLIEDFSARRDHGGGCGQVKKKVNKIRLYKGNYDEKGKVIGAGYLAKSKTKSKIKTDKDKEYHYSRIMWGMIDNDKATEQGGSNAEDNVHTIDEVYSFENYLCMPLNLFYYIKHPPYSKLPSCPAIKSIIDNFKEEEATQEDLQKISDQVIQYLLEISKKTENKLKIFNEAKLKSELQVLTLTDNGYNIRCPKKLFVSRGHDLLQEISMIILGKQDEHRMSQLLFSALERMPAKFLPYKLLSSMRRLQGSEVISRGIMKEEEKDDSLEVEKKVDYIRNSNLIIKALKFTVKLNDLQNLQEGFKNIELTLPKEVSKQDLINFCKDQLQMKKEQITSKAGNNKKVTLSVGDQQIAALREVIIKTKEEDTDKSKKKDANKSKTPKTDNKSNTQEEDRKNAFNQYYNNEYRYSEGDIGLIGEQLLEKYKEEVAFIGVCNEDNRGIKVRIENALSSGKRVIGIFNTGGHWIPFLVCTSEKNLTIYIKDSLGGDCKLLQEYLSGLNLSNISEIKIEFHEGREQIEKPDLVHCGVFALKNASIMAQIKDSDLREYKQYNSFYAPNNQKFDEEYNNILAKTREEFAMLYLQGQYKYLVTLHQEDLERKLFLEEYRKLNQTVIQRLKENFIDEAKKLWGNESYRIKIGKSSYEGASEDLLKSVFEVDAISINIDKGECGFQISYGGDAAKSKLFNILLKSSPAIILQNVGNFIDSNIKNKFSNILKAYYCKKFNMPFPATESVVYFNEEKVKQILGNIEISNNIKLTDVERKVDLNRIKDEFLEQLYTERIEPRKIDEIRELLSNMKNLPEEVIEGVLSRIDSNTDLVGKNLNDSVKKSEEQFKIDLENESVNRQEQLSILENRQEEPHQKMQKEDYKASVEKELEQIENAIKQIKGEDIEQ
jgi:ABC-type Mn2+/Zn2+ transport system ATPase subunit